MATSVDKDDFCMAFLYFWLKQIAVLALLYWPLVQYIYDEIGS
jgi:hypothetical protein